MKKTMLLIGSASLMATLGISSIAHAQSDAPATPWYGTVNLGVGRTTADSASNGLSANGASGSIDQDRTRAAAGLSLGYQITPNFAVEAGWQDLGHYRYNAGLTAPTADSVNGTWRASGFKLVGVGSMPVAKDLSVYGKGGVFFSRTEFDAYGANTSMDQTKDRAVLTVGAGLAYSLTPRLDATAGWDRYQGLGDNASTGRSNIDTYSVGLKYKF